jgi:hypothetical protein
MVTLLTRQRSDGSVAFLTEIRIKRNGRPGAQVLGPDLSYSGPPSGRYRQKHQAPDG